MHSLVIATMMKIEKVAINDALPLKAVRRDAIAKLKFFWGFESELQTDLMPFHLYSLPLVVCGWTGDGTEYRGWVKTRYNF